MTTKSKPIQRNEAGEELRQCPLCGAWFVLPAGKGKPPKYDSEDCRLTAKREQTKRAGERARARAKAKIKAGKRNI